MNKKVNSGTLLSFKEILLTSGHKEDFSVQFKTKLTIETVGQSIKAAIKWQAFNVLHHQLGTL